MVMLRANVGTNTGVKTTPTPYSQAHKWRPMIHAHSIWMYTKTSQEYTS